MQFATFKIGPEPGGRGYKILASTGIDRQAGWAGNAPLVLLGWAKLQSARPFTGRFPVANGAIVMRATYVEEGSSGPIAFANGVFVSEEQLARVRLNERALVQKIPLEGDFGEKLLDVPDGVFAEPVFQEWGGLGLAWSDRQVFVAENLDYEDVALKALESVSPLAQRHRLKGWSTTSQLVSRGDFLTVDACQLLIASPKERLADDRFVPCEIGSGGSFSGQQIGAPASYQLWQRLLKAEREVLSDQSNEALSEAWSFALADHTSEAIAWHLLETVSRQGESFAAMVEVIARIGEVAGDEVGAAMVRRFLQAMSGQAASVINGLVKRFETRLAALPLSLNAVFKFLLWSGEDGYLEQAAEPELRRLVHQFEADAAHMRGDPDQRDLAVRRHRMIQDRMLESETLLSDLDLRGSMALIGKHIGCQPDVAASAPSRHEAHRLFRLRKAIEPAVG